MTEQENPVDPNLPLQPSRRDRLRPAELVGFAGVLAVFFGLVVLLVLRTKEGMPDFGKAGIAAGIVFILVLMGVALLGLGGKPSAADVEARKDLKTDDDDNSGHENWH